MVALGDRHSQRTIFSPTVLTHLILSQNLENSEVPFQYATESIGSFENLLIGSRVGCEP